MMMVVLLPAVVVVVVVFFFDSICVVGGGGLGGGLWRRRGCVVQDHAIRRAHHHHHHHHAVIIIVVNRKNDRNSALDRVNKGVEKKRVSIFVRDVAGVETAESITDVLQEREVLAICWDVGQPKRVKRGRDANGTSKLR